MDLKSILSPADEKPPLSSKSQTHTSTSTPTPTSQISSPRALLERASSGSFVAASRTKHGTAASPLSQTPLSSLPTHVLNPSQQTTSSPLISPVPAGPGVSHTQRSHSTQSIDTLADFASLQQHQVRPGPISGLSLESVRSSDSASRMTPTQASLTTNPRASFDINMLDTSQPSRRTDFSATSLPDDEKEQLSQLASHLAETPSVYDLHVAFVSILHQAFTSHVFPTSTEGALLPKQDPATFELLSELRDARSTMEKLFAVGETTWLEWLQDESMLACTTEERIDVIEQFRKAVSDEAGSSKLWAAYGDWVLECCEWANSDAGMLDEEKLVGKEIFTSQMVLETWEEGIQKTKMDIANSHLVWNKYIELRISEFRNNVSKEQANVIINLFAERLKVPHTALDLTRQILSSFMSRHFSDSHYEDIMADTPRIMKDALKAMEERTFHEAKIEMAQSSGDKDAEYNAFSTYIEWEKTPAKRRRLDFDMCNALYERAELRFPSDPTLWDDHIAFVLENARPSLDLLSRATRHCPWSGSLWSQYLLASERQGQPYEDTEGIKHKATNTGVLDAAGISEALKVHAAWCSFLRRRAFRPDRDEDDADIAEMGIRASMENLSDLAAKLGMNGAPDPTFRLQRIYINFLSESGRWDNARREFDNAVPDYGKSWQFWLRFYQWEMKRWRRFATKDDGEPPSSASPPHLATAVLKSALEQDQLDYPEPIVEAFLSHCEDFEDADELQSALLRVRKIEKVLAARRQIEALQNAQAAAVQQAHDVCTEADQFVGMQPNKRKREFNDSDDILLESSKRSKTEDNAVDTVEQTRADDPKRDREHATILVENLPEKMGEAKVRQFFSNCGTVKSVKMLDNDTSATVEFDDDSAARYALSRDGQQLEDAIISVVLDTGSTVFVTNYIPETGEAEIRRLLQPYGEIISARFPSLQANKNRRFCYVQFRSPAEAQDAVNNLDGKDIGGLALTCKISNPAVKKSRQEVGVNNGQTIFLGGLNFKATEDEIKTEFAKYGKIELIRIPLHETMKNRNKGIAFITFATKEQAQAALSMNGQKIKGREVKVEITQDSAVQRKRHGSSVPAHLNGKSESRSKSPTTVASEPRSERTVFLTAIPDTVNEARLRQAATKHGEVVKVILKTNHQGALLEYVTIAQAGEAALGLDGYEIAPGRKVKVVSEQEMKAQQPEKKLEEFRTKANPKTIATLTPASGFVKRPTQPGNRARKGGNLGQRSVLLHTSDISHHPARTSKQNTEADREGDTSGRRSNSDFRALMNGGGVAKQ